MGAEDFVVRLRSSLSAEETTKTILEIPGTLAEDEKSSIRGMTRLRYEDERHIIEFEVISAHANSAVVTVRFALCHPTSIDDVFSDVVSAAAKKLASRVEIAEDVVGEAWSFSLQQSSEMRAKLLEGIRVKRGLWRSEFGSSEARVTCREAVERFIIDGLRGQKG